MQENNTNIIDITPVISEEISANKIYNLQEEIHDLEGQLSIVTSIVDAKEDRIKELNEQLILKSEEYTELETEKFNLKENVFKQNEKIEELVDYNTLLEKENNSLKDKLINALSMIVNSKKSK